MKKFNEGQQVAIETTKRNVLVLAGAGTGKTTTIIGRCQHLIESGVKEKEILLITFTRRAANEIRSRIQGANGKRSKIVATTFHSWAIRLMRMNPSVFQMYAPTLIDRDDVLSIFRRLKESSGLKNTTAEMLVKFHSLRQNTLLSPEKAAEVLEIPTGDIPPYIKSSALYASYKDSRNYIDYDDVLSKVANALNRNEIAQAIGKRFTHVMIDEMQDTNPLQYKIIDALAPHVNLFCVGDDAQSIYGFRGADFESIHSFQKRYENTTIYKLQENYRSTQKILDICNWLLNSSSLNYDKELFSTRGPGQMPILCDFEDQWGQADYVSDTILHAFKSEEQWSNNMVLVRSGNSARPIEARFLEKKIPHVVIGGQSLLGAAHIKDLMSLLHICANRNDELAWMRYLQLWKGLGVATADRIYSSVINGNKSLLAFISDDSKHDDLGWKKPIAICLAAPSDPLSLFDSAFTSLKQRLSEIYKNKNWETRQRDFIYLRELAKQHKTMQSFTDEYLINPIYEKEASAISVKDYVKIITIHSAKGLEAPRCFVVDVAKGVYPRPGASTKDREEELRVLYVALTRAEDELHISRAERGWSYTGKSKKDDAYLLDELPLELVQYEIEREDEDDGFAIKF